MTEIYLIRHAEAEGNIYRRVQAWYDSRLTARGERQLQYIGDRFANVKLDAVYSSDRCRARRTAQAVAEPHGIEIIEDIGLREVGCGVWEDVPWGEAQRFYGPQLHYFNNAPDKWNICGCEPYGRHSRRISETVKKLARLHEGGSIAVASHGTIIRALLIEAAGISPDEVSSLPQIDNTAVSLIIYEEGRLRAEYIGDASHIPEGESAFSRQVWWKKSAGPDYTSMWYRFVSFPEDAETYLALRRAGGTTDLNDGGRLAAAARKRQLADDRSVVFSLTGDEIAGLVELDIERSSRIGAGWIEYCAIEEKFRGTGLSLQLIGHAVSVYRGMGYRCLRLRVPENRADIRAYFQYVGFIDAGTEFSEDTGYTIMEMDIRVQ